MLCSIAEHVIINHIVPLILKVLQPSWHQQITLHVTALYADYCNDSTRRDTHSCQSPLLSPPPSTFFDSKQICFWHALRPSPDWITCQHQLPNVYKLLTLWLNWLVSMPFKHTDAPLRTKQTHPHTHTLVNACHTRQLRWDLCKINTEAFYHTLAGCESFSTMFSCIWWLYD